MTKKELTNVMIAAMMLFTFAIGYTIAKATMIEVIVKVADATDYRNAYHMAVQEANGWFNILLIFISILVFVVAGVQRDKLK